MDCRRPAASICYGERRLLLRRMLSSHETSRSEIRWPYSMGLQPEKLSSNFIMAYRGYVTVPRKEMARKSRIAFIGRHDRQKGLDILLDTIARFPSPGIRFHVIGKAVCRSQHEDIARFATPS